MTGGKLQSFVEEKTCFDDIKECSNETWETTESKFNQLISMELQIALSNVEIKRVHCI